MSQEVEGAILLKPLRILLILAPRLHPAAAYTIRPGDMSKCLYLEVYSPQ